jgi:pilus assembly protein CpaB
MPAVVDGDFDLRGAVMNRNRLLLIGFVALALGAFVSLVVYRNLQSRSGAKAAPGEDVIVAADDLQVGTKIEDRDIRLVHFPSADLPAGVFHFRAKVVGRGVVLPISRGEFVLTNKLAGENAGSGLPSLIPPGMRAVSVRVNDTTSVSGFVQPGTRVDIMLTGNPQGSNEEQTTTVLENVAVIATGQRLERNSAGEAQSAPVVTLLVSPDDAERLTLASSQGHIQLALRNPLDTKQENVGAVKSNSLYKGVSEPVTPVAPRSRQPRHIVQPPPTPTAYTVEVYKGDKKEEDKF